MKQATRSKYLDLFVYILPMLFSHYLFFRMDYSAYIVFKFWRIRTNI